MLVRTPVAPSPCRAWPLRCGPVWWPRGHFAGIGRRDLPQGDRREFVRRRLRPGSGCGDQGEHDRSRVRGGERRLLGSEREHRADPDDI